MYMRVYARIRVRILTYVCQDEEPRWEAGSSPVNSVVPPPANRANPASPFNRSAFGDVVEMEGSEIARQEESR